MKLVKMKSPGLVLILFFSSLISFAQVERKPSPAKQAGPVSDNTGGNKMDRSARKDLLKEIDLTKEQKGKLKEMREANMAKKESIENNDLISESEKKMQLRELQKVQAQNMQAILTEVQKEKFKSYRQKAMKENN